MRRCTHAERPPLETDLLPHDLLEIASPDAILSDAPWPTWVRSSLERAPFVVVRRSRHRGAHVPVGVRGAARGERFAAWLPGASVVRRVRPEDLAARRGWRTRDARPFSALGAVEEIMAAHQLRWGPAGSVGFELATGVRCVTEDSDLDLLARAPAALSRDSARELHAALSALPVRVDVQLETPGGGMALAEYAAGALRVVLRTLDGPRWGTTPWNPARDSP
jgi:phosphoribosyl-dephospho-CoA transferase